MGATYEFRAVGYTSAQHGEAVYVPGSMATFHLQGGGLIRVPLPSARASITGPGWSAPVSASHVLNGSGSFSSGPAVLSTGWQAVMASATYATLKLQFQWQWWLQSAPGGSIARGHWSPSVTASTTSEQPTTFFPAPLVTLLSSSGINVAPNGTFWAHLGGNVSGTVFRILVESPTGHELNSACRTTVSGATAYNASLNMTYSNGTALPLGHYLVHVHNAGGAIVIALPVVVTNSTAATAQSSGSCLPPSSTSPDSLLIPIAPPGGGQAKLTTGEIVGARYEYEVVGYSSAQYGISVHVPSVSATFYLQPTGTVSVYIPPHQAAITGAGWSSPISGSHSMTGSATLSSAMARLSTGWLAVMANASYEGVELKFQWQWYLASSSGKVIAQSHWSPAITSETTQEQPTEFYAAPLVTVVATAGSTVASGGTYWMDLSGNVSGTEFRALVETATGHELNSVCLSTPGGSSVYNATLNMTYTNGSALPAGHYIVHAHDAGGAIVLFERVDVS